MTMTIREALDSGKRVFWWAAKPGDEISLDGDNAVLWWQDGRDGQPQWADPHDVPDLLAQRDALQAALKRLYWLVTELASDDAFDNGVYAPDGRCEGSVIAAEIIEQARVAIAKVRGEEGTE